MRNRRSLLLMPFRSSPAGYHLAWVLVLGLASLAKAQPSALADSDPLRDIRLTVRARQALLQDPALAGLGTVHVSVRANVATLWGAVPSPELARRAEECLRQVQTVFEVRSELHVQSPRDPMTDFLRAAPRRPAGSERLWFLANRPPVQLTSRPEDEERPAAAQSAEGVDQSGVSLLPPIRLGPLPPDQSPPAAPRPNSLIEEIARLQRTDLRFQTIQVEVHEGVVRLRATGTRPESVFEFAHAISRLNGVERVILQD